MIDVLGFLLAIILLWAIISTLSAVTNFKYAKELKNEVLKLNRQLEERARNDTSTTARLRNTITEQSDAMKRTIIILQDSLIERNSLVEDGKKALDTLQRQLLQLDELEEREEEDDEA